jgi:hypothetical protein
MSFVRPVADVHFLYNKGARAEEAALMTIGDITWGSSPSVRLVGKDNKMRVCPSGSVRRTSSGCSLLRGPPALRLRRPKVSPMASQPVAYSESIAASIPELELLIAETMDEWKSPGLAIAVVQTGGWR